MKTPSYAHKRPSHTSQRRSFSYVVSLVGFAATQEHAAAQPRKIRPALMPQPSDEGAEAVAAEQ